MDYVKLHIKTHLKNWKKYLWLIPLYPFGIFALLLFIWALMNSLHESGVDLIAWDILVVGLGCLIFGAIMAVPFTPINKEIAASHENDDKEETDKIALLNHLTTIAILAILGFVGVWIVLYA